MNWGEFCFLNRGSRRKPTLELYFGKVSLMVSLNAKLKACVGLHSRAARVGGLALLVTDRFACMVHVRKCTVDVCNQAALRG